MKKEVVILAIVALVLLSRKTGVASNESAAPGSGPTRGIRNNNPGNIKISANAWKGKVDRNTDGVFEQFVSVEWGVRAAILTLLSYITRHGIYTVGGIIARWAPSSENQTGKYIEFVEECTGMSRGEGLNTTDRTRISRLLECMFLIENGVKYKSQLPNQRQILEIWENYV